jgi:hypothetical protein
MQMDLVDCWQIILFHLEYIEVKLLILEQFIDIIFASSLEKPFCFQYGWFSGHSAV